MQFRLILQKAPHGYNYRRVKMLGLKNYALIFPFIMYIGR